MMIYTIETIDIALVHHLSMRINRINDKLSSLQIDSEECSVKYEKLIPQNLVEISEQECIKILNGNGIEISKSSDENADPIVVEVPAEESDGYSWWYAICCRSRREATTTKTTPEAPPTEPVPETKAEDIVVEVTEEMKKKKESCVETWIDLTECEAKTTPPIVVEEISPEPIEPEKEETPEPKTPEVPKSPVPISKRIDVPVIVYLNEERQPFTRACHQYYRSSWRLKPSVIGAPETIGYEE